MLGRSPVVVTAHPDDETLWAGGFILRHDVPFTIICCSIPRRDTIRAYKFFKACDVLGAKGVLLPFVESEPSQPLPHLNELILDEFDCVITHNREGEYGHLHHVQVHHWVRDHFNGPIFTFQPDGRGDYKVGLTPVEREIKLAALKAYDHQAPYDGRMMPKYEALLKEYGEKRGLDLFYESFNIVT